MVILREYAYTVREYAVPFIFQSIKCGGLLDTSGDITKKSLFYLTQFTKNKK